MPHLADTLASIPESCAIKLSHMDSPSNADLLPVTKGHLKASKDDDADVPVLAGVQFVHPFLGNVDGALDVLRNWLLRWWKRLVTRLFTVWLDTKNVGFRDNHVGNGLANGVKGYVWSQGGLELYRTWWLKWVPPDLKDIEAGVDAIAWAANATWWEWDVGSRCFHGQWL